MAKFDHDMPHGDILPPQNTACYWQNGNSFDVRFNHVNPANGEIMERAQGENAPPLKTKETAGEKRDRQQRSIRAAAGAQRPKTKNGKMGVGSAAAADAAAEKPANVVGDEEIDLAAWSDGRAHTGILFGLVKKQMEKEGYEKVPMSANEAREMIKAKN